MAMAAAGVSRAVRRRLVDQRRNLLGLDRNSPHQPPVCRHAADRQRLQLDCTGRRAPWRRARMDDSAAGLGGDLGRRCLNLYCPADRGPAPPAPYGRRTATSAGRAHLLHIAYVAGGPGRAGYVPRARLGTITLAMDSYPDQYPADRRDVCRHRRALVLVPAAA